MLLNNPTIPNVFITWQIFLLVKLDRNSTYFYDTRYPERTHTHTHTHCFPFKFLINLEKHFVDLTVDFSKQTCLMLVRTSTFAAS